MMMHGLANFKFVIRPMIINASEMWILKESMERK